MKKFISVIFAVAMLVVLSSGVCGAYSITINDPAGDQIGVPVFDVTSLTYNVNEAPFKVSIASNYPQSGVTVGAWATKPADLLLDGGINGTGWDYAIPLVSHGSFQAGHLYAIGTMAVSNEFEPAGGGYGYNENVPVWLKTGTDLGFTGTWTWNPGAIDYAANAWFWSDEGGTDLLKVGWATATCANDTVGVPEPASLWLLCLGLFGVGALHRRKQSILSA